MPLTKRLAPLVLGPLATLSDAKAAPAGVVFEAQNVYRKKGANGKGEYRKRLGNEAVNTETAAGGAIPEMWRLATHQGSLIGLPKSGNYGPYRYSDSMDQWADQGVDEPEAIRTQQKTVATSTTIPISVRDDGVAYQRVPDVGVVPSSSLALVAYEHQAGGPVEIVGYDLAAGKRLWQRSVNGAHPRVLTYDGGSAATRFTILLYEDGSNVYANLYSAGSGMINGTPDTDLIMLSATVSVSRYEARMYGTGSAAVLVVAAWDSAVNINLSKLTVSTMTVVTATLAGVSADLSLALLSDDNASTRYYLATADTTNGLVVRVLSSALAVAATYIIDAAATSEIRSITGHTTSSNTTGHFKVLWDVQVLDTTGVTHTPHEAKIRIGGRDGSGVLTAADWIYSIGLRSHTFLVGSEIYLLAYYNSTTQPTHFLMRFPSDALTATPKVRCPQLKSHDGTAFIEDMVLTAGGATNSEALTHVTLWGSKYLMAVLRGFNLQGFAGAAAAPSETRGTMVDLVPVTFDSATVGRPVEAAGSLLVPVGQVMQFDGTFYAPLGFGLYLENPEAAASAVAGQLADGVYRWATVIRYTDTTGRIHRSAPAVSAAVTAVAGQSGQITVHNLRLVDHLSDTINTANLKIELYRTTANGSEYYLVKVIDNDPVDNNGSVTSDTVASDADLLESTLLYTTGGVLENHAPPQLSAIWTCRNRVWGIDAENPRRLWYSREIRANEGIGFNDTLTVDIDDEYGDLVGGCAFDEKVIVFKRDAYYVIAGEGPDDLGRGGYAPPFRVPGLGATSPRAIASTPEGVWFKAARGMALLNGAGNASLLRGGAADDWSGYTVLDAVLLADAQQVRFVTTSGVTLVRDYLMNDWYVWTAQTITGAVDTPNGYYQISPASAAVVFKESTTLYTDNGTGYRVRLMTGWLSFAGVLGFERIYQIQIGGEEARASSANMQIDVYYDFNPTVTEQRQLTAAASPWILAFKVARQRCSNIRILVQDGANGDGVSVSTVDCRLSALSILYAAKGGLHRRPAADILIPLVVS